MKETSAQGTFPIHGNKRELVKTKEEWIGLVITALNSKHTGNRDEWGCLSESGLLFKINTLSYTRIPDRIINELVLSGRIRIKKDNMGKGFYECDKQPVNRRRVFYVKTEEEIKKDAIEQIEIAPARAQENRRSFMAMLKKPQQLEVVSTEVQTSRRRVFNKE